MMDPLPTRYSQQGQSLLEIILGLVIFSLLLMGANALFWNNSEDVLYGRQVLDATRLGENFIQTLQTLRWEELGQLVKKPREGTQGNYRYVQQAENVKWTGKAFTKSSSDNGYRRVSVRIYPLADGDEAKPFHWTLLCVNRKGF